MTRRSTLHRLWQRLTVPAASPGPLAPLPLRPGSAATWPDCGPYSEGEDEHLGAIRAAYQRWVPYEHEPDTELRAHLNWFRTHPSEAMDHFCVQVLAEATEDSDVYWVNVAVSHAGGTLDPRLGVHLLETFLRDRGRFRVFDLIATKAASILGSKAPYPNRVLADLITLDDPDTEPPLLNFLRCAAYGGYISTATGFQPGFDEGLRVKGSNIQPTLEMAERFITRWRAENPDARPR